MNDMARSLPISLCLAVAMLAAVQSLAAADDQPTIAKDSVVVTTQRGGEVGRFEKPGWVPVIEYRVNGPIESGSQLSVDFTLAGKPWVSFDCETKQTEKGHWWHVTCGGNSIPAGKQVTYEGPVAFAIHLRNELQGTNDTLFSGKAKVVMVPAYKGAKNMDEMEWYVDEDWRIPIGYIFWHADPGHGGDSFLHVVFWYRGNPPAVEAHLFYQGKDIAKYSSPGNGAADWDPTKHQWGIADCTFMGVYLEEPPEGRGYAPRFPLRKNPGDYEVKVLLVGHLARSIKFTVNADGKFDNGIATSNNLGSHRVIVPVQVIGNQGPWDKAAWKSEAFYGNPLAGFTALP